MPQYQFVDDIKAGDNVSFEQIVLEFARKRRAKWFIEPGSRTKLLEAAEAEVRAIQDATDEQMEALAAELNAEHMAAYEREHTECLRMRSGIRTALERCEAWNPEWISDDEFGLLRRIMMSELRKIQDELPDRPPSRPVRIDGATHRKQLLDDARKRVATFTRAAANEAETDADNADRIQTMIEECRKPTHLTTRAS